MIDFVLGAVFASFLRLIKKYKNITFAVVGILFVYCLFWSFSAENDWSFLAFVGVASLIFTIWKHRDDKKKEYRNWLLRNKEALLIEMVDILIGTIHLEEQERSDDDLLERMKLLQPAVIAHGSKDFLKAWENHRNIPEGDLFESFRQTERLLRAIRKELGRDDLGVPPGHILMSIIETDDREELLRIFKDVKYD